MVNLKPSALEVLRLLEMAPNGLTQLQALDAIGCFRLGARVWELRQAGYPVDTEWITTGTGKRIARYRLLTAPEQISIGL